MRFEPSRTGTEKVIPVHRLVLKLQFASCFVGILSDILKSRIVVVHMIQIESGVIERLVLCFLGYPENLVVLEHGIACLVNLANAEPAVQRIKDINVIDSVGRALNDYPKHLEIQSQGQALISKISRSPRTFLWVSCSRSLKEETFLLSSRYFQQARAGGELCR